LFILLFTACGIVLHPGKLHLIDNNEKNIIQNSDYHNNNPDTIRVMILNLAHGRSTRFHQIFLGKEKIKKNLDTIASLINREKPDVVALQEADGQSFWSGSFNHVEYLLKNTNLESSVQGYHVKGIGLQYGTAIVSGLKLVNNNTHNLSRSALTLPKGFVVSSFQWLNKPNLMIDIVSVHLDFLLASTRKRQAQQMYELLKSRNRPMIIMGDFNTDWNGKDQVLKELAKKLKLKAYQPGNNNLVTFSKSNRRFDWILISEMFEFCSLRVLLDEVSDHRVVVAKIRLINQDK